MSSQAECIFCGIVAGSRPCHKVIETEAALAFMDIHPASEGHTLVIPKRHCETVFDITDEDMRAVAALVRRVAAAIRTQLAPDGLSIAQVNGTAAGQTVMHYHVHLLPRTQGEPMRLHGSRPADPDQLATLARALAAHL